MRIAFVVNGIAEEQEEFTTPGLVLSALARGHEVYYLGVNDFTYTPDNQIRAVARNPSKKHRSARSLLADVSDAEPVDVRAQDLDAILLRNNPVPDPRITPWTQSVALLFAELATRQNVIVLNDPTGLARAMNKLYFQFFPEAVRPRTLISRTPEEIKSFVADQEHGVVLKPLQGAGGQSVFLIDANNRANLNQMIEAVSRDGYVIAQEYLPAAAHGDVRLFMMNGVPLVVNGRYAAIHRVNAKGDIRSNITAGGTAKPAKVTDTMLELADLVRPKLMQDGQFFVGLDIAGDKLMEINVFSPGGLGPACELMGVDFYGAVIDAVEAKIGYAEHYNQFFNNLELSMV